MTALTLNLDAVVQLTDDAFYALCRANPDIQFERTAKGELIVMPPTGGETGSRNSKLNQRLANWAEVDGTGVTFDSSTGFKLPNGAQVEVYRQGQDKQVLLSPSSLSGEEVLLGFVLDLRGIL